MVFLSKLPILEVPHYWDEIGWATQAHWLSTGDLVRAVPGFRPADAFWGHPPGLHLTLAAMAKAFGYSVILSHLIAVCFAFLGVWFIYLLGRRLYDAKTGFFSALFLFFSPMYFAQSGMFLADVPVAALGVMSVYFALQGYYPAYLLSAVYMVLIKETSIAVLVALLLYMGFLSNTTKRGLRDLLKYAVPLFVVGFFFAWQKIATGHFFFIYDPLQFNIKLFDVTPSSIFAQFVRITRWIFVEQHRYLFSAVIALNLIINKSSRRRPEHGLFFLIGLFSGYSFLVLFFLPRYLLPVLPYFYLLGAWSLMELVKSQAGKTAAALAILPMMGWSLATQPFTGNAEFNLKYLDVVALHKETCRLIASEFPESRILTTWPHTAELQHPHLGYVRYGLRVASFRDRPHPRDADLIVVSPFPVTRGMEELRSYALKNGWRLIRRLEKGPVVTELYGRSNKNARADDVEL